MAVLTCNDCGAAVAFGHAYCPTCGAATPAAPPPAGWAPPPATALVTAAYAPTAPPGVIVPDRALERDAGAGSVERAGRRLTATSLGMLVPVAMIWLVSACLVAIAGAAIGAAIGNPQLGAYLTLGVWTLAAALVFWRPVELALARFQFKTRRPTPLELQRLDPVWRQVCARAGMRPERYILRVEDTDAPNAFAAAGHVVAVTRWALTLPDDELAAVLAHELGHHRDLHATISIVNAWYVLPLRFPQWLIGVNMRVTAFIGRFSLAAALAVPVMRLMSYLLFLPIRWALLALTLLGRPAEYAADRHAAKSGYGAALMQVLQRFINMGADEGLAGQKLSARLWSTHPPTHKRMHAIDKYMANHPVAAA